MNPLLSRLSATLPLVLCAALPAPPSAPLKFRMVETDIGKAGVRETRRVFTSQEEYESYFDRRSPTDVDWSKECVAYYSAGVLPTGGYSAKILGIQSTEAGRSLCIMTSLESPGPDCVVTLGLTRPYTLARFEKPAKRFDVVRFSRADVEIECTP